MRLWGECLVRPRLSVGNIARALESAPWRGRPEGRAPILVADRYAHLCERGVAARDVMLERWNDRKTTFRRRRTRTEVMNETPIRTVPVSRPDQLLRDKLIEDIAGQSARMDDLARQLITLDLAVPGLYATALKLVAGISGTVTPGIWLVAAFACWGLALALALISLVPRRHSVDMGRLFADDGDGDGPLSIEGYFRSSALHKRRVLLPSCGLFFIGVCCAAVTVL